MINKWVRGIHCLWLNGEIKKAMHERYNQSKMARKSNLAVDWEKYRSLRNAKVQAQKPEEN